MALVDKVVLTRSERQNLTTFASKYGRVALLHVTDTMMRKSIADAHWSIRDLFAQTSFHNYEAQALGPSNKIVHECTIQVGKEIFNSEVSLYRPLTKSGDPRLWIYGLQAHVAPGHTLALAVLEGRLYVGNLTGPDFPAMGPFSGSETAQWASAEAKTLLEQLKQLAFKGPIPQVGTHDTSVGRSIEHALGISPNSSQIPDYLGTVEIKAGRSNRPSSRAARKQLFAQVPDWTLSECKSIKAFLQAYGYERNGAWRLTCTVEAKRPNSQGLQLQVVSSGASLIEIHHPTQSPALRWEMSVLQRRLQSKHHETFWIKLDETTLNGLPAFRINTVEHTGPPASQLLGALIEANHITLDHLIKQSSKGTTERGPSFKISTSGHELLFPIRATYVLSE